MDPRVGNIGTFPMYAMRSSGLIRMFTKPISLRQRRWLASLLVLTFALRALIPAGFMPAGNGSLALQICPDGFSAAALLPLAAQGIGHAEHHHQGAEHHDHGAEHHDQGTEHQHPGGSSGAPAHDHKSWMSGHCAFGAIASAPP